MAAGRCFDAAGRPEFNLADVATEGRLCVVSINALTEPALAQILFKVVRHDFFDAVQSRRGAGHRLCGMLADEYPLVAVPEDIEQLATVRSKKCFVLAAAQGISGLDERLGERRRRAALLNFNTVLFLRTREQEADEAAFVSLGLRHERVRRPSTAEPGDGIALTIERPGSPECASRWVPICPPGTLGRFQPHQAFIARADGGRIDFPVWFIPWFDEQDSPLASEPASSTPLPAPLPTARLTRHMHKLMLKAGKPIVLTPEVIVAAAEICRPNQDAFYLIWEATRFFREKTLQVPESLEKLPLCWLAAIPRVLWRLRQPHWTHLPFAIDAINQSQGVLVLSFAQEERSESRRITLWDDVRLILNLSIYPSLWRPLARGHFAELRRRHPDLRPVLPEGPSTIHEVE